MHYIIGNVSIKTETYFKTIFIVISKIFDTVIDGQIFIFGDACAVT